MSAINSVTSETILKRTSQEMVDVIYDTMEIVDRILRNAKIEYTIMCGTMLGSYRHGGLIPWDDDGDIAIEAKDEQKLLALTEIFTNEGLIFEKEINIGYRVWNCRRTIVRASDNVNIPFIDIFIINTISDHYEVLEGVKYLFPGETLPFRCFERLIDVPFGHLTLRGMNATDAQRHFDENFGTDWSRVAWRIFDHVTGEEFPKVCINLDRPDLLRPALHSRYTEMKSSLIPSSPVSNGVENHSSNR